MLGYVVVPQPDVLRLAVGAPDEKAAVGADLFLAVLRTQVAARRVQVAPLDLRGGLPERLLVSKHSR